MKFQIYSKKLRFGAAYGGKKVCLNWSFSLALMIFLIIFLMAVSPGVINRPAEAWEMDMFPGFAEMTAASGQMFSYDLHIERGNEIKTGEMSVMFSQLSEEMLEIVVEGSLDGEEFATTAAGSSENPADLFTNFSTAMMMGLEGEVSEYVLLPFSTATMMTGFYGDQFEQGWEYGEVDDFGKEMSIRIPEVRSYAGVEGYLIVLEEDNEIYLEFCQNRELLLPLMVDVKSHFEDDDLFYGEDDMHWQDLAVKIELTDFTGEAELTKAAADRPSPQRALNEMVDFMREEGLTVGERSMKGYSMMGAVAGFGVEIEGNEIELYLYDRETADSALLDNLEQAEETGEFFMETFNMNIPVYINGDIMMTGLEFGSFYTHPARDEIVEAFMKF